MFAPYIPTIAILIFLSFIGLMFFTKEDKNRTYIKLILLVYPLMATYILPGGIGINNFDLISVVFFVAFYKRKKNENFNYYNFILFCILLITSIIGCAMAENITTETFRSFFELFAIFIFSKILLEECLYEPSFFYEVIDCLKITVIVSLCFLAGQFIFGMTFTINRELNVNVFQDNLLRYPGFFQDPQKFGQFLAASSFLFLIKKPDEEKLPTKNYVLLLFTLIALLYTGGRAASGGWVLGFALIVMFGNSKLKLYSILLASIMVLVIFYFKDNFALFNRGDNLSDSYDWRHAIWMDAIGIVKNNFFFGIGSGNYANYVSIHNPNQSFIVNNQVINYDQPESGYLKLLTEYGIIGFISIFLLIITPMINSFVTYLKTKDTTLLLLISPVICWMVSYYTVYSFGDIRIQIIIVTITCMSIAYCRQIKNPELLHED